MLRPGWPRHECAGDWRRRRSPAGDAVGGEFIACLGRRVTFGGKGLRLNGQENHERDRFSPVLGWSSDRWALRKGDFSLRGEKAPAKVPAFKSAGFPRSRWERVSDAFPFGMRGSEVHDQDKQLSC